MYTISNDMINNEFEKTAKDFICGLIDELKDSCKAQKFQGTSLYIENPGKVFSFENFKIDSIRCVSFNEDRSMFYGDVRCCDIFMVAKYNRINAISLDDDKLLLFKKREGMPDETPTFVLVGKQSDPQCLLDGIKIYGRIMVVGFDWNTNSFRDITEEELQEIRNEIY